MNKELFRQHIKNEDFRSLFDTLGWNKYQGYADFEITVNDYTYQMKTIAQIKGYQVIICKNADKVSSSLCKQLDYKIRPNAQDYICIFTLPKDEHELHHIWSIPIRKTEKKDIVLVEYYSLNQTELLYQKIDSLTFPMAVQHSLTIVDVREKIYAAFEVNSERLTKDFYTGFQKQHTAFCKFISGIDDHIQDDDNKNKQWYTSVMLNRLMFCYFIQKKGFLDGDKNYLQTKLSWCQMMRGTDKFYSFYKSFLIRLFYDGINTPLHTNEFEQNFGRIPYLNGGMFDKHQLEIEYTNIDIKDEAFEQLFAFFDKWEWHLDTRVTASGRDINPDVLGYIFEQYINDRAQMGAYYTKEDITEYIGKNCILPFLMDRLKETNPKAFEPNGFVWKTLQESGSKYIYDAVRKGVEHFDKIPENIALGLDTTQPNLLERRAHWNDKTPEPWALPTEIWRETIERLQRCRSIQQKIANGDIHEINDFITYNLDIRQFVQNLLEKAQDNKFILHFYQALLKVTILDPTCGSGAFLFAALNILEPLYEVCINRMREFNEHNPNLFKRELEELDSRYKSNIQYFIYKSIILHNLYGVDIMHEAVEIAKLRLFLKMVAVVDVDMRAPNLGIDPLPDIDFNIRCGNTLVGYATEKQLNDDLTYGDMFANLEFRDKIELEMDKVARTFDSFRALQLSQNASDLQAFKTAKTELAERLANLNALLNRKMYQNITAGSQSFDKWLETHQPFHWLAEYYQIIHGNGGFDVIIGNPPYVVYTKKDRLTKKAVSDYYKLSDYETLPCNNLYAFVIERCFIITRKQSKTGMIIPISAFSNSNMQNLQSLLKRQGGLLHISTYHQRPAQLFNGVLQRLSIFICSPSSIDTTTKIFTTGVYRWYSDTRNTLFKNLNYVSTMQNRLDSITKLGTSIEIGIQQKYYSQKKIVEYQLSPNQNNALYYRSAGGGYWISIMNKPMDSATTSNRVALFGNKYNAKVISAFLNSSLFWWYYSTNFDLFNFTETWMFGSCLTYPQSRIERALIEKSNAMEERLRKNAKHYYINSRTNGLQETVTYQKYFSKDIMDEIDKVLAKHYGFTEEELDFIINYDIKYRMGDELNEE